MRWTGRGSRGRGRVFRGWSVERLVATLTELPFGLHAPRSRRSEVGRRATAVPPCFGFVASKNHHVDLSALLWANRGLQTHERGP